jgi:hypothetical protein
MFVQTLPRRTAGGSVASTFMRAHPGRDRQWIRCDPGGHCRWIGKTSIAAARIRIYKASRGPVATGTRVESSCGQARCVNVDHLRPVRAAAREPRVGMSLCRGGHELTGANVVRHRDGRIAYCRICRNERRRERYRSDPAYAALEMERQRRVRRNSSYR